MAVGLTAGGMIAAPAPAAAAPVSIQAVTSCFALGFLQTCSTNAIQANSSSHCVEARFSGVTAWGNVYDINGTRVGPSNFIGATRICGLHNWYYLTVRNVVGFPGTTGILSS